MFKWRESSSFLTQRAKNKIKKNEITISNELAISIFKWLRVILCSLGKDINEWKLKHVYYMYQSDCEFIISLEYKSKIILLIIFITHNSLIRKYST